MKIYEDSNKSPLLNFKGYEHPNTPERIGPCIRNLIDNALEYLNDKESVDIQEIRQFLLMIHECTKPTPGYVYHDGLRRYINPFTKLPISNPVLTQYGKKLMGE